MKLKLLYISITAVIFACNSQTKNQDMQNQADHKGEPNNLINESSPYLLQHAYNPVNWYPWGEEALTRAKKEDKPILVSIGYSSCHWCHVMERESFENDTIAKIMNDHFVCIKVDREERPDIDQVYMDAVQAMGQPGGWPLNVFLTSDQKPFYGGTYFPPQGWARLLQNVAKAYDEQREKVEKSADQLTEALATSELVKMDLQHSGESFEQETLVKGYELLAKKFDEKQGGLKGAPKFPMPANWLLLMRYQQLTKNQEARDQLESTLDAMAQGGIYDQIGGGFSRYSTDDEWLAPHFEKMLYDNGQLMSLYSEGYTVFKKQLYKKVVYQTAEWLEREMSENGGFYSALDADSEGEEGKFYVWTKDEIDQALGEDADLISAYYDVSKAGNWEGKSILRMTRSNEEFAKAHDLSIELLHSKLEVANEKLLVARNKRVRPGLDDKILAGWNGLMLKGLADAYKAFHDEKFKKAALKNAQFIKQNMVTDEGKLFRNFKAGKATIDGYLEDYAFVIDGFIATYEITFDEHWLHQAKSLTDYVMEHFSDEHEEMFFYTDNSSERLIARKKELFDNVIPSSNSQMAINLHLMGTLLDNDQYKEKSVNMLATVSSLIEDQLGYVSNWGILYTYLVSPTAEVAIVGEHTDELRNELYETYYPNKVVLGTESESNLPLLKGKSTINNQSTIFVCYNKTCKLPVNTVEEALKQLK